MSSHAEHNYNDPSAPPRLCQNCQTSLRGPFCSACGQHDVDYHRSFWHLTHDLLENLFHFEGKFFASVALLLGKPGHLTAEFNAGRRMSQLNPLRFYIFVTLLFFLGVHLLNDGHLFGFDRKKADDSIGKAKDVATQFAQSVNGLTPEQQEEFGRIVGERATKGERLMPAAMKQIADEVRAKTAAAQAEPGADDPLPTDATTAKKKKRAKTGKPADEAKKRDLEDDENSELSRLLKKKIESGELTFSKVIDTMEQRVPSLLFLGMPIFALLLKLLYWRSKRYYIEHLIFSVHLHTWLFLAAMVATGYFQIATLIGDWLVLVLSFALVGWGGWYLLASFHRVYGQRWLKTTAKLAVLGTAYFFTATFMTGIMIVGTLYLLVYH